MGELFEKWEKVLEIFEDEPPENLMAITCMMVDMTAIKSGMTSADLLKKISPIIVACNEFMGAIEL